MVRVRQLLAERRLFPLPFILALAAFLRLFGLQNGQYGSDDERLWAQALAALANHQLPMQGIKSSIGIGNGPFQVYLMMLPAAIWPGAPIAGAIFVALVNVAGVYAFYRFVHEFFGPRPAWVAALLFAVSSWAVIYARRMQAQDLLVPFQVLFFWNAARWLKRARWLDLLLMSLWLAVLSQVYILGLIHLATAAVVLVLGWRRWRLAPMAGAAALWLLLSYRYLFGLVLQRMDAFAGVGGGSPSVDFDSLGGALLMATHQGYQTIAGQAGSVFDATAGFEGALIAVEALLYGAGGLFVALRLVQAARSGQGDRARLLALVLVWLALPIALFARHSVPLYPYYFTTVLPLPALLTALLFDRWWPWFGRPALAVFSANSLALAGIFFAVIPGYYTHNDYGLPYHQTFDIARRVEQLAAQSQAHRVYVDGDFDPSDVMSSVLKRAGLDVFWFDDYRTPEFAAPPPGDGPALYLTMAGDTDTARFLQANFPGAQAFAEPLAGEGVSIRAYLLQPAPVRAALNRRLTQPLNLSADNGMRLEAAYTLRRPPAGMRTLPVDVSWSWGGGRRPSELQYSMFAHLLDGGGRAVAQVDRPLLPSADWLAGELVVQWLDLPLPAHLAAGHYQLELGVYADNGAVRQRLMDATGKATASGSLILGPVIVPPPAPPPDPQAVSSDVSFGDGIRLTAYRWRASPGAVTLGLRWQAMAAPSRDYTVYVHLLDAHGRIVAQADGQPRGGDFPTSTWLPGDRVEDRHTLSVPPGRYTVEVGLYYLPTLERLPGGPLRFEASVP
ncbi:MAG: hypothetical protein KGJ86_02275 [Chloroflexota bacterium]|nr:hypothetical protein [Chloroflexota bacterium]